MLVETPRAGARGSHAGRIGHVFPSTLAGRLEGTGPFLGGDVSLTEQVYSPTKIAAVAKAAERAGMRTDDTLAGTGLHASDVSNPEVKTSVRQLLRVGQNCLRLGGAPDLGFEVGANMHASSYGIYGYALLCSPSLRHFFDVAVRYHRLATPVMAIRWKEDGDKAVWMLPRHEELSHLQLSNEEYRFFLDLQFTIHATLTKDAMGQWCVPSAVRYSIAPPTHPWLVSDSLGCPAYFHQIENALEYPRRLLDQMPTLSNQLTAAQLSEICGNLLDQLSWQAGISRRVHEELTKMPGRFPEIEEVAATLCMTSRTLRRRLEAEGTSYSTLLSAVRYSLAMSYLTKTSLSIEDIAIALGFSDGVGFRHAFRRWSGRAPAQMRREMHPVSSPA